MTKLDERTPPIALTEQQLRRLAAALDRDGIVAGLLFGSQASGRGSDLSDVDVAVWLEPSREPSLDLRLELTRAAARALGTDEIDLVILNDAPPLLRERAVAGQRLIVDRDPKARVRFEARALLDYLDTKPLRAELDRGLRHRVEEDRFGRP